MRIAAVLAVLACVTSSAGAQRGRGASRAVPILVRDVTVIDGTGSKPVPHQSILLRDGRIARVAATSELPPAAGDSVIDGRGLFAIPGLIDAHVHLGTDPWDARAAILAHALRGGVTSVLDLAGDARATGDLQRAVSAGQIPGPHIYYVALFGGADFFADPRTVDASRGYVSGTAPWMKAVSDTTNFQVAVTLARGTGAMGIKLYAALDSVEIARATAEAHRQGLRVIAHATTFPGRPADLAAAGVDVIAHAPYLVWQGSPRSTHWQDRARGDFLHVPANGPVIMDLLRLMRAHNSALNPTLWIFANELGHDSVAAVRSPWMYTVTREASHMGVRIVAGTDELFDARLDSLPILHRELQLLVDSAGLTPLQAITSATANGAWAMGIADSVGTILAGKLADLVLLGGDPTADIRHTRDVRVVIQRGRVVEPR